MDAAHPSTRITPHNVTDLCNVLLGLKERASTVVDEWDLDDDQRSLNVKYHEGRRDAYDVALYWANELAKVLRNP